MQFDTLAEELSVELRKSQTQDALQTTLDLSTRLMGFDHFALSCDFRPPREGGGGLLIHNYPEQWANVYVGFDLAGADPVRRACDKTVTGFRWTGIGALVPLTPKDRRMLAVGRECGLADGYTVPRHLPGAASGSCSFVVRPDVALPSNMLFIAEIIGALALENALRLLGATQAPRTPVLSDRQRECVLWSARGKTASEIAVILGISVETVIQHLKIARDRYEVHCRQSLILCAINDGTIGLGDVFRFWCPR